MEDKTPIKGNGRRSERFLHTLKILPVVLDLVVDECDAGFLINWSLCLDLLLRIVLVVDEVHFF